MGEGEVAGVVRHIIYFKPLGEIFFYLGVIVWLSGEFEPSRRSHRKSLRPLGLGLFSLSFSSWSGFSNRSAGAMLGCGSIPMSRAGKFTYPNVTMIYLDRPAVGARSRYFTYHPVSIGATGWSVFVIK